MNLHQKQIEDTEKILSQFSFKELKIEQSSWNDVGKNNFILRSDTAYELGSIQGCGYQLISSKIEMNESHLYLCGKDLAEIKENKHFLRVAIVKVKEDENLSADQVYNRVKQVGYSRYRVSPEGYMLRVSASSNEEKVRISKQAIEKGISFKEVGNMYLKGYKMLPYVENVSLYFISDDIDLKPFLKIAQEGKKITDAMDHVMKGIALDCDHCAVKPICDEVQGMRELHEKKNNE